MMLTQTKLHISNISNTINMNTKNRSAAILYHYPCPDGVFAALAAHLYFKATSLFPPLFFPNTVYTPLRYSNQSHHAFIMCFFTSGLILLLWLWLLFFHSLFRAEDLPLNEIGDLYLLDFVGPPGFVQEISTKVPRYFLFRSPYSSIMLHLFIHLFELIYWYKHMQDFYKNLW